jgi:hypothetical protein
MILDYANFIARTKLKVKFYLDPHRCPPDCGRLMEKPNISAKLYSADQGILNAARKLRDRRDVSADYYSNQVG